MSADMSQSDAFREMLARLNELEAVKRLLDYDVQTELLRKRENEDLCSSTEQEVADLESKIAECEKCLRQTTEQIRNHEEARAGIEKSIEHEMLAHASLKQELDETMTAKKHKTEDADRETFRRVCHVKELLHRLGAESGETTAGTTDAEARSGVDKAITLAHAQVDSKNLAAMKGDTLMSLLGAKDDVLLRTGYACFRQAKESIDKNSELLDAAVVRLHKKCACESVLEEMDVDATVFELTLVDAVLKMELPESLRVSGEQLGRAEILRRLIGTENEWLCENPARLLGQAYLQKVLEEDR
ncbi:hypothetical protein TGVEG_227070 [Toxoplasma gondii VEG]|uniref:Uncharacterized protein n=1 Tax=Toxoplasma gondii (strain ATCC 50861 / VEG) TaxID=432359 RepID=V4ZFQ9_TOXGV|nr:hypothetical protein TGVEG_227070 [Toxoplasma gondii VEG]